MGRLTLNVLLSFAQFEREVTGERIRDKIAASKGKDMLMAGSRRSATTSRNENLSSKRRPCAISFGAILNSGRCAPCGMISPAAGIFSKRRMAADGSPLAASGFRVARFTSC